MSRIKSMIRSKNYFDASRLRKRAKTDKKGVYNMSPMFKKNNIKSDQEDVQNRHVEDHMSDRILKKINSYESEFMNDFPIVLLCFD